MVCNTLKSQDNREELRALPLNRVECGFYLIRRFEFSMRHHLATYERLMQERRQLMEVFVRF
jgi:hypothetical protein